MLVIYEATDYQHFSMESLSKQMLVTEPILEVLSELKVLHSNLVFNEGNSIPSFESNINDRVLC